MQVRGNQLYLGGIPAVDLAQEYGTPLYVYEEDTIRTRYAELVESIPYRKLRIHYACKANVNVEILKLLREMGANVETVSKGEILLARKAGFAPEQILYTCSNATVEELHFAVASGVTINLDSFAQIRRYGELRPGSSISIRINQGIGAGHHAHVITGGPESKFGIDFTQLEEAKALAKRYNLTIVGIHQHIGSNVLDEALLIEGMKALLATAARLAHLEFVDFGGGLGIPYRPDERRLNIREFGRMASALFADFCRAYGKELTMVLEPGRYLVAEAGTLLATVTDVKRTPHRTFVGIDTGFNHLIRPAMYGSYHPILNASCVRGREEIVTVAGNLCEAGDLFAKDRKLPECKEGDILAILNAGAYGFSMSSNYNARPRPAEVLVSQGQARVIRARERME
nr:diaminopimelate decarboxylase [Chloroflexota bacterium]